MNDTNGTQEKQKAAKVRRKPERKSRLRPTFAAARFSPSGALSDHNQPESRLLQRRCACGTHTIGGGECDGCRRKRESGFLQRMSPQNVPDHISSSELTKRQNFTPTPAGRVLSQIPLHSPDEKHPPVQLKGGNVQGAGEQKLDDATMRRLFNQIQSVLASAPEPPAWIDLPGTGRDPDMSGIPTPYQSLLWDCWEAANGTTRDKKGNIEGALRQERALRAWRQITKIRDQYKQDGTADWVKKFEIWFFNEVHLKIIHVLTLAEQEKATQAVNEAGAKLNALLNPQQLAQEKQIQSGLATAIAALGDLSGQMNNLAPGDLDAAYQKIMTQQNLGGALAQNLRGMAPKLAIAHLNDVLGGLKAVMDLSDPQARKKMFDQKLGKWGYVKGGADLMSNIGSVFQGAISGLAGLTAAAATVAGHADTAAKILAHASKATGALGKAVAVLSIVKGGIALFHPDSSAEDRASGAADIAAGAGALIGGSVGAGLSAAALSFKINLSLLKAAGEMTKSLISIELRKCYSSMARSGEKLALYANRVIAGQQLVDNESDPTKKAHLKEAVNHAVALLRWELRDIIGSSQKRGGIRDPGTYKPLRERFAKAGSLPTDKTPITDLIEQARTVIKIIEQAFADYETVLNETTIDAWRRHG